MHSWNVYMVCCSDGTLYTGVTTDVLRRIDEHNSQQSETKYTRVRQPVRLVYSEQAKDRRSALSREYALKQLSRNEKLELIKKNTCCKK